jgi:hypothetical protein
MNLEIFIVAVVLLIIYLIITIDVFNNKNIECMENTTDSEEANPEETEKEKIILVQGMIYIHKLFEKHNIWYSIAFGTLLGSVRHWGIIPWDDDLDLFIKRDELGKFEKIIPEIEKFGYRVEKEWKLYRIHLSKKSFVDLFIIDFDPDSNDNVIRCAINTEKCEYPEKNHSWWWKWFNFSKDDLLPLKKYQFEDILVWGPNNPEPILKFWYGEKCLTECKTHFLKNHVEYIGQKILSCGDLPDPQL